MTNHERHSILSSIAASIDSHGYHVRVVQGGAAPRFLYTIGLHLQCGFEIVMTGALYYTLNEAIAIVNAIASGALQSVISDAGLVLPEADGVFELREVDASWRELLLLGANDFFAGQQYRAMQVVPDSGHWTADVPNMTSAWDPLREPAWRWTQEDWTLPISANSLAFADLDALRGVPVREVVRWEEGEWEMFTTAGPDVCKDDVRIVPFATLLAYDNSLDIAASLSVGSGLWRQDSSSHWQQW